MIKFADLQFSDWLTNKICGSIKRNSRIRISQKFSDLPLWIEPKNLQI